MKKALGTVLALIMTLSLTAFAFAAQSGGGKVLTLKLAHGHAAPSMVGQQYQAFADAVDKLSGGSMKIELHVGGSLLTDPETLNGVMDGIVDITHVMSSFASGTVKDIAPLEVYGFYSGNDWQGFLAKTRPIMEKIYEPFGVKFLGSAYQGEIAFICAKKQIMTPDDMKGMTFRSAGTWYGKCVQAFGAAPTAISLADMPTAFERGTVQGTVVGWNVIVPLALHQTAKYLSSANAQTYYTNMLMNMDRWKKLTKEQQDIIMQAALVFEVEAEKIGKKMIAQYIKAAEANGNSIYYLTEAEQRLFLNRTLPVYDEMTDLSANGRELLRIVKEGRAQ